MPGPPFARLDPVHLRSLYVHVPFCQQKCNYCDFYSQAGADARRMVDFTSALLAEAALWKDYIRRCSLPLESVFLGGGTPTSLPVDQMQRLLSGLSSTFPISPDAEWTIEANPATIDREYCQMMLANGANRLSLGAQSLVDEELHLLGRIHNAQEVRQTVKTAQDAGFRKLSIDLMYAVPGQTLESWRYSLTQALDMGIDHLSCYCLTLEERTPLWRQTQQGSVPAVDEQTQLSFMRFTRQFLEDHGLCPYEISNYARPGSECRHNINYWREENYLGLGPAAASHIQGRRWRSLPNTGAYTRNLLEHQRLSTVDDESLTSQQRAEELIMMMLRLRSGLEWQRLVEVSADAGIVARMSRAVSHLRTLGLLSESSHGIHLTEAGVFVADEVIRELVREAD